MSRLSIIGSGYVGLVSAACFAELGHDVVCVDVDAARVDAINRGDCPIHEPGLPELLLRHTGQRLRASTDLAAAVLESDVTFIAVGTPTTESQLDLRYIRAAARSIGEALARKAQPHVVVVKSTVLPGTTDTVVAVELARASGKRAGADFGVGMNPEFLTEGVAVGDFMAPDRIVIGGDNDRTMAAVRALYAPLEASGVPVIPCSNATAETIKYASNALLATMISFSNEFGRLTAALGGVDVADVLRGVQASRYLTATLPDGQRLPAGIASFLWAGCGYGGSCLPKDTQALASMARMRGEPMPLMEAVIRINAEQPLQMMAMLEARAELRGLRVTVLGLAFKPDTDDVRESPTFPIVQALVERGARVTVHDPVATDVRSLPPAARFVADLDQALDGCDAVLLITRWPQYQSLDARLGPRAQTVIVVDGRRVLDPRAFGRYAGIGRS